MHALELASHTFTLLSDELKGGGGEIRRSYRFYLGQLSLTRHCELETEKQLSLTQVSHEESKA